MAAETSFFRDRCLAAIDFWAAIGNPCSTKRGQCSTSRRLFSTKGRWKSAKVEILGGNDGAMLDSTLEMLCRCFGLVSDGTVDVGVFGCLCLLIVTCCVKMCYTAISPLPISSRFILDPPENPSSYVLPCS